MAVEFDEARIDALFAGLDRGSLPGAAVGIAIDGVAVYRKGFGLCSMDLPTTLSPTVRMRIGSTTKHFTCLAYLLLCEDGKAGLDDPIGKHLPELHGSARHVTLRQLMGHVSGVHCACTLKFLFSGLGGRATSNEEVTSFYQHIDTLNASPGKSWIYNNGGYSLLTSAIERITGKPLEQVLRERIFEPIGMYDTLLRRFDTDFVANSATTHMLNPQGKYERAYWGLDFAGGGAMVSTINDMLRWLAHMDRPIVGNAASWTAMTTSQVLANGTATKYGLGLRIDDYRGVQTIHHAGGWLGGNAQMLKVPSAHLDVVIIVNREDASAVDLVDRVLDACLPSLQPVPAPKTMPPLHGVYRSRESGRVIQLFSKNDQQIMSIDAIDIPVQAESRGVYHPVRSLAYLQLSLTVRTGAAPPHTISLKDYGNTDELSLAPPPGKDPPSDAILGTYRCDTIDTEITIREAGEGLAMTSLSRFGAANFTLEWIAEGLLRARSHPAYLGGILSFSADARSFQFSFGPNTASRLRFRKR